MRLSPARARPRKIRDSRRVWFSAAGSCPWRKQGLLRFGPGVVEHLFGETGRRPHEDAARDPVVESRLA